MNRNISKLIVFILLSFLPVAGIGIYFHLADTPVVPDTNDPSAFLVRVALSSLAMIMPMLAVIFTQLIFKEPVFKDMGISFRFNRWWVIGWLLMPVIALAVLGVSLLMPGAEWNPAILNQIPEGLGAGGILAISLISGMMAGATLNAVFAFGEEIAWRGYLLKIFNGKSFLEATLWIGIIWGLWHAPIILTGHNFPQHPIAGVFMMVAACLLLTPMLMYFRQKSGSVLVPAIMHGTFNGVANISQIFVTPANDLLYGSVALSGLIVLLIIDIVIFCIMKKDGSLTAEI